MTEFIVGFMAGVVFIWIFQLILAVILRHYFNRQLANLEQSIKEQNQSHTIIGRVEEINGCFYIYDQETDKFLAQGNSMSDLSLVLKQRWPDLTVFVKDGNKDAIQRLKATQQVDSL